MIKRKILYKIGCYIYNLKIQFLFIDCDKLLFFKKYKNIKNLLNYIRDKRAFILTFRLLEYRLYCLCLL
jgi:hypothetical protein